MDFAKGGPVKLRNNGLDPQDVALVLERLEVAMPHLHFNKWKVTDHQEDDAPIGEVKWKSNDRLQVEARLDVQNNIRIWTICERDFGAVALDDYEFLLNLVDEAAALIGTSLTGAMSLFEFGTNAIAAEVQRLLNMEENPVAVLRFVRSLALETYENQRLSYGLIFSPKSEGSSQIAEAFDNKRAKRLTDGFSTALILDVNSRIADYAALNLPPQEGLHLSRRPWWTAGLAETAHRLEGAGIALLRCGDMLVMHNNRLAYSQRAGHWRVWRHSAILARLESKWTGKGNPGEVNSVLRYLYHVALDLSFRRSGGLLVVVFSKTRISDLLSSRADEVNSQRRGAAEKAIDKLVGAKRIQKIDRRIITDLASLDGAVVVDRTGRVLAYGAMTKSAGGSRQGARTRAAIASSREGLVIKVSSDGNISFFADGNSFMEL